MRRYEPVFEGFIVRPRGPTTAGRLATLTGKTLGGVWRARSLGPGAVDYLVAPARRRRIAPGAAWDMVAKLRARSELREAEPAFILPGLPEAPREAREVCGMPAAFGPEKHLAESDDCEWSVRMCRARAAWAYSAKRPQATAQGADIVVAHPDTGYTTHPAIFDVLRLRTREGYDFHENVSDASDPLTGLSAGHGTSTASVIMSGVGSRAGDGAVVTGIAPRAALVPLRVSDSVVHFSYAQLCAALYHAVAKKCHVVSMSLGGPWRSPALDRAVRHALDHGLVLVAAAGNYWPWVVHPAKCEGVLAITACNARGRIWKHASTGPKVALAAPGESVWRAWAKRLGDYRIARSSGTSYATAATAGACALWLAHHGRAKLVKRYGTRNLADVFATVLARGGVRRPAGWRTNEWGAGILDARKLLAAPLPPATAIARLHRARVVPRRQDDLAAVMEYFPGASEARVKRALAQLFGIEAARLEAVLGEVGDELCFHLATDPALRKALIASSGRRTTARRRQRPPREMLAHASQALRRRLAR